MIGMNIAPGFNRDFAFEEWNWVDPDLVQKVRDEAEEKLITISSLTFQDLILMVV